MRGCERVRGSERDREGTGRGREGQGDLNEMLCPSYEGVRRCEEM